jgi:hypothetical protein
VFSGTSLMNLICKLLIRWELEHSDSSFHTGDSWTQAMTSLPFETLLTILGAEKRIFLKEERIVWQSVNMM